jgi:hypothetical protein
LALPRVLIALRGRRIVWGARGGAPFVRTQSPRTGCHGPLLALLLAGNQEGLDKEIESHITWDLNRERELQLDGGASHAAAAPHAAAMEAKPS